MSDAMSRSIREQVEGRHPMANDTTRLTDDECDRIARRMVEVFANTPLDSAPSDVKGEDDETDVVAVFAKLREISGNRWDSVDPDEYVRELRGGDCPLTPLTDPSVRGVLVDDGEPRKVLAEGEFYFDPGDSTINTCCENATYLRDMQPVTLRPASDFGVAGGERIKELEAENSRLRIDRDNYNASRDHALNAIAEALAWPDAKNRTIENAVSNLLQRFDLFKATHNATLKGRAERIKELEAELAKRTQERDEAVPFMAALKGRHNGYDPGNSKMYPDGPPATPEVALNELIEEQEWLVNSELQQAQSDAERQGERIKELEAAINRQLVEVGRLRRLHQEAFTLAIHHQSDAERLRKAIKDAISWLNCSTVSEKSRKILLAALGSPPNAEHQRQGSSQASDQTSTAGGCNEPPSPAAASGSFEAAAEIEANTPITSAPAAESQGNDQHHIEGAKIPGGGSGIAAAESEGGENTVDPDVAGAMKLMENELLLFDENGQPCFVEVLPIVAENHRRHLRKWMELFREKEIIAAKLANAEDRIKTLEAQLRSAYE